MGRTTAGFFPVKTLDGAPPVTKQWPLVRATAYYEGAVLRINATTGSAGRVAAAGTAIMGVLACSVSSANTSTGKYPVYLANDQTIFEAKMIASSTPPVMVGSVIDVALATVHQYRLQATGSTNVVQIYEFDPDEALTAATGGMYWVKFTKPIFGSTKTSHLK